MENESWPNLFWQCHAHQIPVVLANARISPSSFKTYQRIRRLMQSLLRDVTVLAKSREDANRFLHLGANPDLTKVCGNLKHDLSLDQGLVEQGRELRSRLKGHSFVWVGASTREGEEEQLLRAHALILKKHPDALLILVPRHPERFSEAGKICRKMDFSLHRRTESLVPADKPSVYLGDTMGELPLYYAAADLAFVGGSLAEIGGHNMLEPAALGLPVFTGPHLFNFREIADKMQENQALSVVNSHQELLKNLKYLFSNPETMQKMGERAKQVVEENKGAVENSLSHIIDLLPRNTGTQPK